MVRMSMTVSLVISNSKLVDRNLEHRSTIRILWNMPGANIDLQRGQDELRYIQGLVALGPHPDEIIAAGAMPDVDVPGLLLGHRGFPGHLAAAGSVVVAHEQAHLLGQAQDALDTVIERSGISAGKVGTRRPAVGHEQ